MFQVLSGLVFAWLAMLHTTRVRAPEVAQKRGAYSGIIASPSASRGGSVGVLAASASKHETSEKSS